MKMLTKRQYRSKIRTLKNPISHRKSMNSKGGNDYERKFEQKKHGIQKDVLPNVYGSEVIKK